MKITGVVKDKTNGEPLGGASIYVADADGKAIKDGGGVAAKEDGSFTLDSAVLNDPTAYLAITHAGYQEDIFLPKNAGFYTVELEPSSALDAVVVTAKKKAKTVVKKKNWIWWVAGSVAAIGLGFWIYKAKFAKKK